MLWEKDTQTFIDEARKNPNVILRWKDAKQRYGHTYLYRELFESRADGTERHLMLYAPMNDVFAALDDHA
jgi:hypothetical protein